MIELGLELIAPCNYSCWYCNSVGAAQEPVLYDLDKLAETYSKLGVPALTCIYCGGGEPTLHPQIREILNIATSFGGVYMWTNASVPVEQWWPDEPEKIFIDATLHPEANIPGFNRRMQAAQYIGVNVRVTFVGEATRLHQISQHQKWLEERGFSTAVYAYRDGNNTEIHSPRMERRPIPPSDNPSGRTCIAGRKSAFIRTDAQLYRCAKGEHIDTLLTKPTHCNRVHCPCSLQLHNTITHTPRFEEICARLA